MICMAKRKWDALDAEADREGSAIKTSSGYRVSGPSSKRAYKTKQKISGANFKQENRVCRRHMK